MSKEAKMTTDKIDTGIRFFGQKIYLESSGKPVVDAALKSTFKDDYCKTAPLEIRRIDAQVILKWQKDGS